jgi:hypothetical protein
MPSILEPLGAGVLVALISKYVINNKPLCDSICETCEAKEEETEIVEECSSSNTTSVNSAELVHVHHFDPWMHT